MHYLHGTALAFVHCHTGSLETALIGQYSATKVHCHTGSLESQIRMKKDIFGFTATQAA